MTLGISFANNLKKLDKISVAVYTITKFQLRVSLSIGILFKSNTQAATDYEIRTESTVLDFIINIFTGVVSVNFRTVTVRK